MVTLACLAAAGFMLGVFFNAYALAALCIAIAAAGTIRGLDIGVVEAAIGTGAALVVVQAAYFGGVCASRFIQVSKPASAPTSQP